MTKTLPLPRPRPRPRPRPWSSTRPPPRHLLKYPISWLKLDWKFPLFLSWFMTPRCQATLESLADATSWRYFSAWLLSKLLCWDSAGTRSKNENASRHAPGLGTFLLPCLSRENECCCCYCCSLLAFPVTFLVAIAIRVLALALKERIPMAKHVSAKLPLQAGSGWFAHSWSYVTHVL